MKIENHAVAMNAQYYNVKFESTEAKIQHSEKEFTKDSTKLESIKNDKTTFNQNNQELSRELSNALLKNINSQSSRLVGDRVEITHIEAEAQELNFSVSAIVQAEGKEIELNLDVSLSRSFVKKEVSYQALQSNLADPLVINLQGQMPSLSSKTFSFDIDSDGESDQISRLNAGNVFLALDKNENGKVDDGNELFGTKSGDGFADLEKYDEDKNGWIDENDPIFNKLRIWEGEGDDARLVALGEVGVGAIFLGNTKTPFSLKDETNSTLGEIRSSSFVLFENGKAGVISQIDLAVTKEAKEEINIFNALKKDINVSNIKRTYANNETNDDSEIEKIQAKIKSLESDLRSAKDGERAGIQARIAGLYSQMMSLLEVS